MPDIFDYIAWRGDLNFDVSPCNEVDNFIFCMAAYVEFNRIYYNYNPDIKISIKNISEEFCKIYDAESVKNLGIAVPWDSIRKMLFHLGRSKRFSGVTFSDFTNEIDFDREMQFSAVTFHLSEEEMFVAFRGTDDYLVGWKEDFRLSYSAEIPAQKRAVEYLTQVAGKYPNKKIFVAGHSKGGNLAKYSSMRVDAAILDRIIAIYNNDGPGFIPEVIPDECFDCIKDKVTNFVPQSSMIGQIFQHHGRTVIVKSSDVGLFQHDMFGWDVKGTRAVTLQRLTKSAENNHEILNHRMRKMTAKEREDFVEQFCRIIDRTGAKKLQDVADSKFKNVSLVLRAYNGMDKERKQMMSDVMTRLFNPKALEQKKKKA